jgi:hypothetical protein
MQAARTRIDDFSDLVGASRLSIEAYVQRVGSNLQLGSGLVAHDSSRFGPAAGEARMVVNGMFDRARGLQVDSAQAVGQGPGSPRQAPGGAGNPNRSPGGSILHPNRTTPNPTGGRPGAPGAPTPGSSPGANPGSAPAGSGGPSGPGGMGSPGGPMGPGGGMGGGGLGGPGGGMGGGRR